MGEPKTIPASRILGNRIRHGQVKTHAPGRTCPECGTRVSVYNPAPTCFRHTPKKKPQIRGRNGTAAS